MGTLTTALAEGVCLAEKSDLRVDEFLRVLDNGAMSNPVFRGKGPGMAKGEYPSMYSAHTLLGCATIRARVFVCFV